MVISKLPEHLQTCQARKTLMLHRLMMLLRLPKHCYMLTKSNVTGQARLYKAKAVRDDRRCEFSDAIAWCRGACKYLSLHFDDTSKLQKILFARHAL